MSAPLRHQATNNTTLSSARVVASYAHTLWDAARAAGMNDAQLSAVTGRVALDDGDVSVASYLA